ncbi:MAG TPA: sugar phosphate isomerase/epimerase [Clostridia bacterium]|nr:sugar phosphate isomerase/epimerase [Clostridia bacterium]
MSKIKIGTCLKGQEILTRLPELIQAGFETVELYIAETLGGIDFVETSKRVEEILGDSGVTVSSIGFYCNPLQDDAGKKELEYCIDHAHLFHAGIVATFAGALSGRSVEEAIPKYKEVFGELAKRAESKNIKIGLENAHMYGFWYRTTCNIGFCPKAWEMMFDAVSSSSVGLEWEPSHQLEQFIDPVAQLKEWMPRIVHIHGKDAAVDHEYVKKYGAWFGSPYCRHRFPGLGDSDWKEIFTVLEQGGYSADIAIEGFHDPVFCGEREMEGQRNALQYLKACREGR